jgi:hypothetical protein
VLGELWIAGAKVHLRNPAWESSLVNWAKLAKCPRPPLPPKAKYTISELRSFSPPGTKRFSTDRLKLSEDGNAVTILGVRTQPGASLVSAGGRVRYWLDSRPAALEIHNGTGAGVSATLQMRVLRNPTRGNAREILFEAEGQRRSVPLAMGDEAVVVTLPLELKPGTTMLSLWVPDDQAGKDAPAPAWGQGSVLMDRLQVTMPETARKQQ